MPTISKSSIVRAVSVVCRNLISAIVWTYLTSPPPCNVILWFLALFALSIWFDYYCDSDDHTPLDPLEIVLYVCLCWRWIINLPRYRLGDPFAECDLCKRCREVIQNSRLLVGTCKVFARMVEWHPFYSTVEEMQKSRLGCHLCDTLLSSVPLREQKSLIRRPYPDYGSIPTARMLENGNLMIKIWVEWAEWGLWPGEPKLYLQLYAPDTSYSNRLEISEETMESRRIVTYSTGSLEVISVAKEWIDSCTKHPACQIPSSSAPFLPTRLICVGKTKRPVLRLVEGTELRDKSKIAYLALSHCWGGDINFKLTIANYFSMKENIDIKLLSKNFQDAISTTRRLGVSYLWIDSLCILQDSVDDWARESATMGDVFAHALCTISATASACSQGGCFRNRRFPVDGCNLLTSDTTRLYIGAQTRSIKTLFDTRVEAAPLSKRAWVFQERLLSRRILHFCSDIILFECNTLQASEFYTWGSTYRKEKYIVFKGKLYDWDIILDYLNQPVHVRNRVPKDVMTLLERIKYNYVDHSASRGIRGALDVLQSLATGTGLSMREKLEFNQRWYELLTAYTEGALTRPTDKVVALSGIAGVIQRKAKTPYLAGLWDSIGFEFGLLWRVRTPREKQPVYCAPSWSWASVNGPVELLVRIDLANFDRIANAITFHAKVNLAVVTFKGEPVLDAASLVDGGFPDLEGLTASVAFSRAEPNVLTLVSEQQIPFVDRKVNFAPDWTVQPASSPTSASALPSVDTEPGEDQLIALLILTTPCQQRPSELRANGLVLRSKPEPVYIPVSVPKFERVGVFWADGGVHESSVLLWEQWTQQNVRIV